MSGGVGGESDGVQGAGREGGGGLDQQPLTLLPRMSRSDPAPLPACEAVRGWRVCPLSLLRAVLQPRASCAAASCAEDRGRPTPETSGAALA